MLHLLLVRHGETAWNVEHRLQGQRADLPLTERGRAQAAATSCYLKSWSIGSAYCSDALRARQTAQTICDVRGLSPVETPSLRELDFGDWEGLTHEQARDGDPIRVRAWEQNPLAWAPPGGESLEQLAHRVQSFVQGLLREHVNETVLLVSHGGPLRVLLATSLGLAPTDYWRLRIAPGSLSELHLYSAGGLLTRLNYCPDLGKCDQEIITDVDDPVAQRDV
ncbi:MAG TPA: histidine phosphatase family protein [Pirellulales bacterium]|jgi:broad specificity phosphatase PhoE|nr:histidine phosphatase family protein [Pirellulales bacterium]